MENIDSLNCQKEAIVLKEEDIFRERTPQDLEDFRLSDLNLSSIKAYKMIKIDKSSTPNKVKPRNQGFPNSKTEISRWAGV